MFKNKLTEQIFVKNTPGDRDQLNDYHNTINLKRYFLKIKDRVDNGDPLGSIPQYWIPRSIFHKSFQATFGNMTAKINIKTYIELLNANNDIKPLYISKKIIVDKNNKSLYEGKPNVAGKGGIDSTLRKKADIVSLRQIIYNIASGL